MASTVVSPSTRRNSPDFIRPHSDRSIHWPERCWYVGDVELAVLQDVIERTYGDRDRERGVAATVAWLCEELGELAQAVRKGTRAEIEHEFSDVLAWVATLANQVDVDLTAVMGRYADGCPKCAAIPCTC